jgi:hypothetical protein
LNAKPGGDGSKDKPLAALPNFAKGLKPGAVLHIRAESPLVGDIGSCVSALLAGLGSAWPKPAAAWTGAIAERRTKNVAKMAETLAKNPAPMNFHSALNVVRDLIKANPDAVLVNDRPIDSTRLLSYERDGASRATLEPDLRERLGVQVIAADLLSLEGLIRHDPQKTASVLVAVLGAQAE